MVKVAEWIVEVIEAEGAEHVVAESAHRSSGFVPTIPGIRRVIGAEAARALHCPFCDHADTRVTDSRLASDGRQIRRRRECLDCGERFTTFEAAELLLPRVIKGDGSREPFDEAKLMAGMVKALEKRPVGQ